MATASFSKSYGRRLCELLQEQQEPFLVDTSKARRLQGSNDITMCCPPMAACKKLLRLCNSGLIKKRRSGSSGNGNLRCVLSKVLCSKAIMRRVLRWDSSCGGAVLGCFSGGGEEARFAEFRRLSRSGGIADDAPMDSDEEDACWKAAAAAIDDSSRQLSPVSVLELHSDEASPVHSHWEDDKPSTSGSSPAFEDFLCPISPCFTYNNDKICAAEKVEKGNSKQSDKSIMSMDQEQMSSWEKIAGDISKIPKLVELDFSRSIQEWRQFKPEVTEIGSRIETLIFEEIRRETVRDMLTSHCTLATTVSC